MTLMKRLSTYYPWDLFYGVHSTVPISESNTHRGILHPSKVGSTSPVPSRHKLFTFRNITLNKDESTLPPTSVPPESRSGRVKRVKYSLFLGSSQDYQQGRVIDDVKDEPSVLVVVLLVLSRSSTQWRPRSGSRPVVPVPDVVVIPTVGHV